MRVPSLVLLLAAVACQAPEAPELSPQLEAAFDATPEGRLKLLVVHRGLDRPDLRHGGRMVRDLRRVPVSIVELDRAQAREMARQPGVHLVPDAPLMAAGKGSAGTSGTSGTELALEAVGADRVHDGDGGIPQATGDGIVIAMLDSGVRANHKALPSGLLQDWKDFVDADGDGEGDDDGQARKDPFGHGTMVAGVLAGSDGIAPDVSLISARVLDADGAGSVSGAVSAIDWILDEADTSGVRILHLSVGAAPSGSFTEDPLAQAVEAAVEAGLVVVAAAGNYGSSDGVEVYGGILSPAHHPFVLTVGASDSDGTSARSDDVVASFSSRGPTLYDGLGKPDVVAPGADLTLHARSGSTLWTAYPSAIASSVTMTGSGTSFSAPVVTGIAALALEVDPDLGPTEVKGLVQLTASQLGSDDLSAGAGLANAAGAVRLADYWRGVRDGEAPAVPDTWDTIQGETVHWGLRLHWDGYAVAGDDLPTFDDGGAAVGDIGGTGILWDGWGFKKLELFYLGFTLEGDDLLDPSLTVWADDPLWGTGILWDGDLKQANSRVWSVPALWRAAFVSPDKLTAAGPTAIFDESEASDLVDTTTTEGLPAEPDWDLEE